MVEVFSFIISIISYRTSIAFIISFLDLSIITIIGSNPFIALSTSPTANTVNSKDVIRLIVLLLNFLNGISAILSTKPFFFPDSKYGKISSENISKAST